MISGLLFTFDRGLAINLLKTYQAAESEGLAADLSGLLKAIYNTWPKLEGVAIWSWSWRYNNNRYEISCDHSEQKILIEGPRTEEGDKLANQIVKTLGD